ncbi:unnamed protein product [Gadus morhua 'NCC']
MAEKGGGAAVGWGDGGGWGGAGGRDEVQSAGAGARGRWACVCVSSCGPSVSLRLLPRRLLRWEEPGVGVPRDWVVQGRRDVEAITREDQGVGKNMQSGETAEDGVGDSGSLGVSSGVLAWDLAVKRGRPGGGKGIGE